MCRSPTVAINSSVFFSSVRGVASNRSGWISVTEGCWLSARLTTTSISVRIPVRCDIDGVLMYLFSSPSSSTSTFFDSCRFAPGFTLVLLFVAGRYLLPNLPRSTYPLHSHVLPRLLLMYGWLDHSHRLMSFLYLITTLMGKLVSSSS